MLNMDESAHAAVSVRLEAEPVIWLTTVTGSGQPQSSPVWFLWDGEDIQIYGVRNGLKTRNIKSNPRVSLHLDGDGRGGGNVIFEGTARIDPTGPRADTILAYAIKYSSFIESFAWILDSLADDYPHFIRVTPARARIW
jgi:PPOX class probable F420-dependent enzyme